MSFTEQGEIVMHAELAVIRERAHKLVLVREIAASRRLDKIHYLRLRGKLAVWRRNNGFDRSKALAER